MDRKDTRYERWSTEMKLLKAMALQLGVSERRLQRDAQSGKLIATKKAEQWYVTEEAVERYRVDVLGREPQDFNLQALIRPVGICEWTDDNPDPFPD
jgi:hypothetical protein